MIERSPGLVVIDEEQRFGVAHKERLKKMRATVDVLTMSATPIPRTLNMSLVGIRDMSVIETPPRDRLAIQTHVVKFDQDVIRRAITTELERGGQVYFVHNRVESIFSIANLVHRLVPDAKVGVGHGQMEDDELEKVMVDFVAIDKKAGAPTIGTATGGNAQATVSFIREYRVVRKISVKLPEPEFEGQTKGKLGNAFVTPQVAARHGRSAALAVAKQHFQMRTPAIQWTACDATWHLSRCDGPVGPPKGTRGARVTAKERRMAYSYTNKKNQTYFLHGKQVTLQNGRQQRIFYFAKEPKEGEALEALRLKIPVSVHFSSCTTHSTSCTSARSIADKRIVPLWAGSTSFRAVCKACFPHASHRACVL